MTEVVSEEVRGDTVRERSGRGGDGRAVSTTAYESTTESHEHGEPEQRPHDRGDGDSDDDGDPDREEQLPRSLQPGHDVLASLVLVVARLLERAPSERPESRREHGERERLREAKACPVEV